MNHERVKFFLRVNLPASVVTGCYVALFDPSLLGMLRGFGIVWIPCYTILFLLNYMVCWKGVILRVRRILVRGKKK